MSWQPVKPSLSVVPKPVEYQVTQHTLSVIPSSVVSIAMGSASAYPFFALNLQISLVLVNSMPINWAPIPSSPKFSSDGSVIIISGAASESSCVITGPGNRILGVSSSSSVP